MKISFTHRLFLLGVLLASFSASGVTEYGLSEVDPCSKWLRSSVSDIRFSLSESRYDTFYDLELHVSGKSFNSDEIDEVASIKVKINPADKGFSLQVDELIVESNFQGRGMQRVAFEEVLRISEARGKRITEIYASDLSHTNSAVFFYSLVTRLRAAHPKQVKTRLKLPPPPKPAIEEELLENTAEWTKYFYDCCSDFLESNRSVGRKYITQALKDIPAYKVRKKMGFSRLRIDSESIFSEYPPNFSMFRD